MASSPQWKIYRNKEYVGCCKYAEDAAAMVALRGDVVKCGHSLIVWTEGSETFLAGDSYDRAAELMERRRYNNASEAYKQTYGSLPA